MLILTLTIWILISHEIALQISENRISDADKTLIPPGRWVGGFSLRDGLIRGCGGGNLIQALKAFAKCRNGEKLKPPSQPGVKRSSRVKGLWDHHGEAPMCQQCHQCHQCVTNVSPMSPLVWHRHHWQDQDGYGEKYVLKRVSFLTESPQTGGGAKTSSILIDDCMKVCSVNAVVH